MRNSYLLREIKFDNIFENLLLNVSETLFSIEFGFGRIVINRQNGTNRLLPMQFQSTSAPLECNLLKPVSLTAASL